MKMHTDDNKSLRILRATVVRISGRDDSGNVIETRQMTYITDNSDKLFISREACVALGMVLDSLPTTCGATKLPQSTQADEILGNAAGISLTAPCDHPRRKQPPTLPTKLPFPATAENRTSVSQYLLVYYQSSTFNTFDHQPLPLTDGPPLYLMVDHNAKPVAYHTPVPVPLHRQELKACLDQGIHLGVLESVLVGEPFTWCHRMVVCARKNGKPRRTVDIQLSNAHATRETHHTPSHFHQARSVLHAKEKTVFKA